MFSFLWSESKNGMEANKLKIDQCMRKTMVLTVVSCLKQRFQLDQKMITTVKPQ